MALNHFTSFTVVPVPLGELPEFKNHARVISYLGMSYRKSIHPHSPASPFIFYCMIQENTENVVNHLCDLLLFRVLRVNVSQRKHPVLPH